MLTQYTKSSWSLCFLRVCQPRSQINSSWKSVPANWCLASTFFLYSVVMVCPWGLFVLPEALLIISICLASILEILQQTAHLLCFLKCSQTCLKRPLKRRQKKRFSRLIISLKAGQKYCRMYFWPALSYHLSLRPSFYLSLSGCFRQVWL